MADARKGGHRPRPYEAPRPGLVWLRCGMCLSTGETLSRWTTELGGKWIRCPKCFGKGWVQEPDKPRLVHQRRPQPERHPPETLLDGLDLDLSPARHETRSKPPKTPSAFPRTGLYQGSPPRRTPSSPKPPKKRRGIGYGWMIALVIAVLVLGGAGYVAYLEYENGPQHTPLLAALYLTPTPTYAPAYTPTSAPDPPTSTPAPAVPTLRKSGFQPVRLGVLPPTATPTATSVPPTPVTTWTPITVKSSGRLVATPTPYQPIAAVVLAGSPTPRPPTATPMPRRASTPGPLPTATAIPAPSTTPTAVPTPLPVPHLRNLELKLLMLKLINEARATAGVGLVGLGENDAAQLHAESAIENCFSGHWGIDGLKPYMRYSLHGGYQSNGENASGVSYCYTAADRVRWVLPKQAVRQAMEGLMNSPGHRRNILKPQHRKVNIGIAFDRYRLQVVQHFEGDYTEYDTLPSLQDRVLSLQGRLKNGADTRSLGVQVYHDPPPVPLTQGQLSRTYCYDYGDLITTLRPPAPPGSYYPPSTDTFTTRPSNCPDPRDVPADAPPPSSGQEAIQHTKSAHEASRRVPLDASITLPWVTAQEWTVSRESFNVVADLGGLAEKPGVYTILVWAELGGNRAVVSTYSIFKDESGGE